MLKLFKKALSIGVIRFAVALAIMPAVGFVGLAATGHLDPGQLSAMAIHGTPMNGYDSHAEFEQECTHCHAPIHCVTPTKCQDCHLEISQQLVENEGLHAKLPGTDKCQSCHHEHNGREAHLTSMPVTNVDHLALTGFSLEHHLVDENGETLNCEDCHAVGIFEFNSEKCRDCHEESKGSLAMGHTERFGDDCRACHDGVDRMLTFDHNTVFVINGEHADLDCEECHVERTFAGMSGDCESCHLDVMPEYHIAEFGHECQRCHGATAWLPAELKQHAFRLDHAQIEAKDITCNTCHPQTYVQHTCVECHEYNEQVLLEQHPDVEDTDIEITECTNCHITGTESEIADLLDKQENQEVADPVVEPTQEASN